MKVNWILYIEMIFCNISCPQGVHRGRSCAYLLAASTQSWVYLEPLNRFLCTPFVSLTFLLHGEGLWNSSRRQGLLFNGLNGVLSPKSSYGEAGCSEACLICYQSYCRWKAWDRGIHNTARKANRWRAKMVQYLYIIIAHQGRQLKGKNWKFVLSYAKTFGKNPHLFSGKKNILWDKMNGVRIFLIL